MYSDFFFCHNCKIYEDAVTSGATRNKIKRESKRFACTAQHTDYRFPTHRLLKEDPISVPPASSPFDRTIAVEKTDFSDTDGVDVEEEGYHMNLRSSSVPISPGDAAEDTVNFDTLAEAYHGLQKEMLAEMNDLSARHEVELATSAKLRKVVEDLKVTISGLRDRNHSLVTSLEYYKKKMAQTERKKKKQCRWRTQ